MATLVQLERALVNADKAGDMDGARKLAAVIKRTRASQTLPGVDDAEVQVGETVPKKPDTTIGEDALGAAEAGLGLLTAATGGTAGGAFGFLKGMAKAITNGKYGTQEGVKMVHDEMTKFAGKLTYEPGSQAGKDQFQAVGDLMQNLIPIAPLAGEMGMISQAAKAATPAVQAAAETAVAKGSTVVQGAMDAVRGAPPNGSVPTPGTMGSAGSAAVDIANVRRGKAEELGFVDDKQLTQGQASRDFAAQQFERENAKAPDLGAPIRERFTNQNRHVLQKMDAWIDETGAEAPDLRSIGQVVDKALRSRAAKDKAQIRTLYNAADKAGEMGDMVDLSPVADYLNQNRAGRSSAPILSTVSEELGVQGIGGGSLADGTITTGQATVKQAEALRKTINRFAKSNDPNDLRVASELKNLIDQSTEGKGGDLYNKARAARSRYARDYEDNSMVANLLGQKKGSTDRAVAMEDVVNRSVVSPSASLDNVRNIRRLLQTQGPEGTQAWRELQGATLRHIKEQATKNVARNEAGDPIVSAYGLDSAIRSLDKSGKLDFVFGKQGAEQLRTLNDVAKDILTVVPGSVNTSNTAAVLMAALDIALSGSVGVPAPVASSLRLIGQSVKNAKTKSKIQAVLGN